MRGKDTALFFLKWRARFTKEMNAPISRGAEKPRIRKWRISAGAAIFYHIYPLGACGAPRWNDFNADTVPRLEALYRWLDPIQELGVNALYLGPVFESSAHGYDTADYFQVDRRLGNCRTLADFSKEVHRRGLRLVLDGVFNHTGRDFWAFRDVLARRENSTCAGWFSNLNFGGTSPFGDPFEYEGWSGHFDLVKLNLALPEVRGHLFNAVRDWVDEFEIDGLRLDAADQISTDFLADLGDFCRSLRPDFWLMGEMVSGDYNRLLKAGKLDSVTNYEACKGLYSSHNDHNYFEIAHTLRRQFGPDGIYRGARLYSFADNHDVNRVASQVNNPAHLIPLYGMLFTMPGIPSIYYGSEYGIEGRRRPGDDSPLRPVLDPARVRSAASIPELPGWIATLAALRRRFPALCHGGYQELLVKNEQLAFLRPYPSGSLVAVFNCSAETEKLTLNLPMETGTLEDALKPGVLFKISAGQVCIPMPPAGVRVLTMRPGWEGD